MSVLICFLILLHHSVQTSCKSQKKNSWEKHAYVYEDCPTICPYKEQCIMFYMEHKFPILCCVWGLHSRTVLHLWCMTRLTILLCSTVRVTRAVQKSWLWQWGSLYIFLCVRLLLYSPPWLHEICLISAVWEYTYLVHTEPFSGWCWNEWPLTDLFTNTQTYTHVCTHSRQPADPASCFIVNIGRLRGCLGWRLLTGAGLWR